MIIILTSQNFCKSCIHVLCCIANYHKLRVFNNTSLLSPSFCESGIWTQLSWVLCLGSHRLQSGYRPGLCSHLRLPGAGSASKLPEVVGKIHFFVVLRFMAVCFFKARGGEKEVGEERDASKRDVTILCNRIYVITRPITFSIFNWIKASPRFCPYSGGGDYTKV